MSDEASTEIVLDAPAADVWEAVTDPEQLSQWLGSEVEIDPRPGGDLTVDDRTGWVEEVEPGRRLSFWWSRPGEDATRVEIDLEEDEHGTTVRVAESRPLVLVDAQAAELVRQSGGTAGPQMLAVA